MTIDDLLHQFRDTGRVQVGYNRTQGWRDIIVSAVGLLVVIAIGIWCEYQVSLLSDYGSWVIVFGAGIALLFLIPIVIMIWVLVLLAGRVGAKKQAPGLVLTPEGIKVATVLTRPKVTVLWSSITAVYLRRGNGGKDVVSFTDGSRTRYVPRFLEYDAHQLYYLIENARFIATDSR